MYVGYDWPPAAPNESEVYAVDFSNDLAMDEGETLISAVFQIKVVAGTDSAASSRLTGSSECLGAKAMQRVEGLQPGVKYLIEALATTSLGNKLSLHCHVTCQDPA